jgi:hypothetical protein
VKGPDINTRLILTDFECALFAATGRLLLSRISWFLKFGGLTALLTDGIQGLG